MSEYLLNLVYQDLIKRKFTVIGWKHDDTPMLINGDYEIAYMRFNKQSGEFIVYQYDFFSGEVILATCGSIDDVLAVIEKLKGGSNESTTN